MRRITCLTDCALALFCMLLWVPIAWGQQTSASEPQPAPTITAKMIDLVDSSRDPAGKQYRAGLIRPVNIGNGIIIAQGSAATVVLVKNGSGWNVQLSSLVIQGQVTTVTSNPGTVIGAAAQASVANAANAANAALGRFGRKPNTYSPAAVVAMGERVVLTPGISLSFVLNAIPVVPEPSSAPAPVAKPSAPAQNVPAQARTQLGTTYLCWIWTDTSYYRSGVFHVAANTSLGAINDAFENYLRKNYHLQFSGSSCPDLLSDPDGQTVIRQIEQWAKATKKEVISVDWKYVPGQDTPPPPQAVAERTILYFCSAYFGPNGENMAFSDSFQAPEQTDINSVRDDFVRFVREKYSPHDSNNGGCQGADNKAKVKEESATREHRKIIETGWKPVASGKGKPSYCSGFNANKTEYFSDIFEMPPNTALYPLIDGFGRFVVEKYGLDPGRGGAGRWDGGVVCPSSDNKDPDKQNGIKSGYKIVETGWKPKSFTPQRGN